MNIYSSVVTTFTAPFNLSKCSKCTQSITGPEFDFTWKVISKCPKLQKLFLRVQQDQDCPSASSAVAGPRTASRECGASCLGDMSKLQNLDLEEHGVIELEGPSKVQPCQSTLLPYVYSHGILINKTMWQSSACWRLWFGNTSSTGI